MRGASVCVHFCLFHISCDCVCVPVHACTYITRATRKMSSHAYENKTNECVSQVVFLPRANRGPSGDTIEASGSTWAPRLRRALVRRQSRGECQGVSEPLHQAGPPTPGEHQPMNYRLDHCYRIITVI